MINSSSFYGWGVGGGGGRSKLRNGVYPLYIVWLAGVPFCYQWNLKTDVHISTILLDLLKGSCVVSM